MRDFSGEQGDETNDSRETNKFRHDPRKGLGGPVELRGIAESNPFKVAKTSHEMPAELSNKLVHVNVKDAPRDTPTVVTKTIRIDRAKAPGEARESGQVELKFRISTEWSRTKPVRVRVICADKATRESPAAIKALSEWIADDVTKSLFESPKAGLPGAEDQCYLILTSDLVADVNEQAHQVVGSSVESVVGNVAGLPPGFAEVTGGIAEEVELPLGDPIENTVTSLRLTGMAIDILSGGLPIAEFLDCIFDEVKKALAEEICEALTPQSRGSEVHATRSSTGMIEVPGPGFTVVNTPRDFGARFMRIEKDSEPPRLIVEEERRVDRSREAEEHQDKVPLLTDRQGFPDVIGYSSSDEWGKDASRLDIKKALERLRANQAMARLFTENLARFDAKAKERSDPRVGRRKGLDTGSSILTGRGQSPIMSVGSGPPSTTAGQPSADDEPEPSSNLGEINPKE